MKIEIKAFKLNFHKKKKGIMHKLYYAKLVIKKNTLRIKQPLQSNFIKFQIFKITLSVFYILLHFNSFGDSDQHIKI